MAKQAIVGWVHEPLGAILSSRAKVAALRILWRASAAIPYREVVRRSGMAYGSIDLALGELTATGLVEELEGGRERRVRLRSGHRLAASLGNLFQVESDFFASFRIELRTAAQGCESLGLLSAALIGPVARREESLGGPIDLLLIGKDAASTKRCMERLTTLDEMLLARFGVQLKVIPYDLATARAMWRTRTPAAERGVNEAELLTGAPLMELLS
jgi:DNA-binding transcriptional ArsR family regulator